MAYDLKYDKLLRAIECGRQGEAISLFQTRLHDPNEGIRYLFEDGKRFTVTPLYWAVRHNCPKVCRYLLRNGARPYGTMVYEYYPLHEACSRGSDLVVQEFVSARCELNKVNHDADTPLHVACMRGHIQCVHILLRAGADCNLPNKLGHTPLQCAVYHDRNDLVELFKAHNKGIETTPTGGSAHQKTSTVSTLVPTPGVRVQRSHSLNAGVSTAATKGGDHPQKRASGGHGRVRASLVRPQSYYEEGASSLVIGQKPLTAFTSQSLQSLSGLSSSSLSSYPTISTHLPTHYSTHSPDSPVELDAPKHPSDPSSPTVTTITVPQPPRKHSDPPKSPTSRTRSKPSEDFGTKHGSTGNEFRRPERPARPAEEGNFPNLCPFPSPGGARKEPSERKFNLPKHPHPLAASARLDHHRHHGDKLLQERLSHPEFNITKRDIQIANRAKSTNDILLGNSLRREDTEHHLPTVSSTRSHINSLAASLCASLEPNRPSTQHLHPSSPLHPLLAGLRASLATQAHRFGLSPDHHKCLSELPLPQSSFPSLDSSSSPSSLSSLSSLQPSFQEVDFEVVEGPLERRVWAEEGAGSEAFATLLLKVQVCDVLVQLRSQMNQGDIVLLKVKVRLESGTSSMGSASLGLQVDHLPEAVLLRDLPPHPNITSILYHCRGQTEKFRKFLIPSETTFCQSCLHSITLRENSHSGTTECPHGNEDRAAYTPATTGTFLFQSAPGVSLDKYFAEFLQTEKKEAAIEDKFLHILSQLLLAVAHLQKNRVSHCAISSRNVYISEKGERVVLGDFGQAVNLRPMNLDVFRKSLKRLKASKTRQLSPEAEQSLSSYTTENTAASTASQTVPNLEEAFSMSDSYSVGVLFYDLFAGKDRPFCESDMPFIHSLSFRCNHLLQKLVARDPSERFSALQGAVSCFVLLFGPRMSDITSSGDCLQWLVSESLELYLNPVLRDSKTSFSSSRDSFSRRRLHYSYLVSASPELMYDSCLLFSDV